MIVDEWLMMLKLLGQLEKLRNISLNFSYLKKNSSLEGSLKKTQGLSIV